MSGSSPTRQSVLSLLNPTDKTRANYIRGRAVTPSLVERGARNDLSKITLRPLGLGRDFHCVGEDIDTAQHALAGVGGKANLYGHRAQAR